jgi:hypothetical protein
MLQAHSYLWHYLWVAPNILLLVLGLAIWRRKLHGEFPAFFAFAIFGGIGQLALYAADVAPSITPQTFWRVDWASLIVEGVLKFAVIGEIFAHVFGRYSSLARLGRFLIRAVGVVLVLVAALAAAYGPKDSIFGIVAGAHVLEQTIYLIESGLLVLIFGLSYYFRLSFGRRLFGIAIGLSISACVHLAAWAVIANAGLPDQTRYLLDFLEMATYHLCVLIWFYYLLVPPKVVTKSAVPLPENNLEIWNRELERLVQQ